MGSPAIDFQADLDFRPEQAPAQVPGSAQLGGLPPMPAPALPAGLRVDFQPETPAPAPQLSGAPRSDGRGNLPSAHEAETITTARAQAAIAPTPGQGGLPGVPAPPLPSGLGTPAPSPFGDQLGGSDSGFALPPQLVGKIDPEQFRKAMSGYGSVVPPTTAADPTFQRVTHEAARFALDAISPDQLAKFGVYTAGAEAIPVVANLPAVAGAVAKLGPAALKTVDVMARTGPGAALIAKSVGDQIAAGKPKTLEQAVDATMNGLLTATGAWSVGAGAKDVLSAHPGGEAPAPLTSEQATTPGKLPISGTPEQAARTQARELRASGQRLAAEDWAQEAKKVATDKWAKVFGDDIPVTYLGKNARIEYSGADPKLGPQFNLVEESSGKPIFSGTGRAMQNFLSGRAESRGPAPAEEPPAIIRPSKPANAEAQTESSGPKQPAPTADSGASNAKSAPTPENSNPQSEIDFRPETGPASGKPARLPIEGAIDFRPETGSESKKEQSGAIAPAQTATVPPAELTGDTATVKTARGTKFDTQYAIVPASQLVTSDDTALNENPAYPAELQPRDRTRAASEAQISELAGKLDPNELGASYQASTGAPIVGSDNVVESGNGRTIALKRLYEGNQPNAAKYRAWVQETAPKLGVQGDVSTVANPVLVRVRTPQPGEDRAQLAREMNENAVASMSESEQATSDAKQLTPQMMALFAPSEDGDVATPANRHFVRAFFDGAIAPAERGNFQTSDGTLSQAGVRRVRNAIFAKAYGAGGALERMAESPDNEIRNVTSGMVQAAGHVAALDDAIAQGNAHDLSIAPDATTAAEKLAALRAQGQSVPDYLAQIPMFGGDLEPEARQTLALFDRYKRSPKKIGALLTEYSRIVQALGDPRQQTLGTSTKPPSKMAILKAAAERVEEEHGGTSGDRQAVLGSEGERARSRAAEEARPAPGKQREPAAAIAGEPARTAEAAPAPAQASRVSARERRRQELRDKRLAALAAEQRPEQARMMRPFPDLPFDVENASRAELLSGAHAIYKPGRRGNTGVVYVNEQARFLLAHAGDAIDDHRFQGLHLGPRLARHVIRRLGLSALSGRFGLGGAKPILALRSTLKQALAENGRIIIADAGPGQTPSEVKATLRHESHHAHETDFTPDQAHEFLADPLAHRAARALVEDMGYNDDPVLLASEIGAHLNEGAARWPDLGLTREQAETLEKRYVRYSGVFHHERMHPILRRVADEERPHSAQSEPTDLGQRRSSDEDRPREGRGRRGGGVSPDVLTGGHLAADREDASPGSGGLSAPEDERRGTGSLGRPASGVRAVSAAEEAASGERAAANPVEDLLGDERGSIALDLATLGISRFVRDDVVPSARTAAIALARAHDDILSWLAPAARGPEAKTESLIVRANAAELARDTDRARAALNVARRFFASRSEQDNYDFMDRVEQGQPQASPELDRFAAVMRQLLDNARTEVQALGTGKLSSWIANYFPHLWKDPQRMRDAMANFGKRPMEGSKSFLKRRKIQTIRDGLSLGLEPISSNPVELVLAKVREMQKYVMAHRILDEMHDRGLLQFRNIEDPMPDGYAAIDDRVGTVYGPRKGAVSFPNNERAKVFDPATKSYTWLEPDDITVHGMRIMGQYVAPEPAARVLNNYLSPGLADRYALFRAYLGAANMLNQAQLGWSAFHLGFTTMDAATSKLALGIYQIAHGDVLKGLATAAATPIAPVTGFRRGRRMVKEWDEPGTQGSDIARLVDAVVQAGGRARMDEFYRTHLTERMMQAFRQGNIVGAALRLPFALTEQAARPILEYIVPRQKLGVFADMAEYEIERLGPGASEDQVRAALARAWDSVDNRMGELVYDNLFWNKMAKDAAMASVRSVGWNVGTVRELAGAGPDTLRAIARRGDFTPRMAYAAALPMLAALIGGVTYYLFHGRAPEQLKDYFFPRDSHGRRWSFPTYMKDVYAWKNAPLDTAAGKVHPLASLIWQMIANKDYAGHPISKPTHPWYRQLEERAAHVGEAFEPIAVRQMLDKRERNRPIEEKALPFIGITRAPKSIDHPGPRRR